MSAPARKTDRFEMRLHPGMKARWEGMSAQLGYKTLALFIEDTIETVHFPEYDTTATILQHAPEQPNVVVISNLSPEGPGADEAADNPAEGERAGDSVDEPENEVALEVATPAHLVGGEPVAPACPAEAKHRKGAWCKTCRKVT